MPMFEAARVKAVKALGLMGSPPEPEFDRLARLVGHVANTTYAHVCFIDGSHQFIKAMEGATFPRLIPRDQSLCVEAVLTQAPLIIADLKGDARPPCRDLHDRYGYASYASVPVRISSHHVVGAVAVMSHDKLALSDRQLAALHDCADLAGRETLIKKAGPQPRSSGVALNEGSRVPDAFRAIMTSHIRVLRAVSDGVIVVRSDGTINFANAAAEHLLGRPAGTLLNTRFEKEVTNSGRNGEADEPLSPLSASLIDGAERLVRSALFCRNAGHTLRVGYVVSPIVTGASTIGAVVIFRALESGEFSNGVDLRNTLREVAKLKDRLAKAEGVARSSVIAASRSLPSLASGSNLDFAYILDAIRDEQANQTARAQVAGEEPQHTTQASKPPQVPAPEWGPQRPPSPAPKSLSRSERWLSSDIG